MSSKSLNSRFFLYSCKKIFLDFKIFFSILKCFSQFWNFFLDSKIFFLILKIFSISYNGFFREWLWNIFFDFNIFFLDSETFFFIMKVFSRFWKLFLDDSSWPPYNWINCAKNIYKRQILQKKKNKLNTSPLKAFSQWVLEI